MDRDEKYVKLGMVAFQRFHKMNYRTAKEKSYEDFMNSRYYKDFCRFGKYLLDVNAINPTSFMDYIMKNRVPLAKWTSPPVYEQYVRALSKVETADAALDRNIRLMEQWARDTNEPWTDFFRKISPPLAVLWIKSGRISPWLLYLAPSSDAMFERMSDEQLEIVWNLIDPDFWKKKLARHAEDAKAIRAILTEFGV